MLQQLFLSIKFLFSKLPANITNSLRFSNCCKIGTVLSLKYIFCIFVVFLFHKNLYLMEFHRTLLVVVKKNNKL